ncbi:Clavesin-2 [Araneus ventricosus]|uniref:Clavesin-2 n=1 Tax=Araneus ventricosus TaxID=182803 RepID=A0A4Y2GCN1_ARAVE|nr:Clavesin-2 [Araneus ventricosus]
MIIPKDGLYPFLANAIPEEFKKKSEAELFENDGSRRSGLQQLKECVFNDKDLDCRTTDDFLIKFLRARKFNIPKAFSLLKKHMGFKSKNKDIFTGFEYDVMAALVKEKVFGFLPHRCKDGCAVLVVHLDNWNPSKFSIKDISRGVVLFFYHSIRDPLTQINGYKVILDVSSSGLKHLRFCTPSNLYLLYNGTQECFPGRFKGIHIMNMSRAFQLAYAVVYPFLSEKLKKRIIFHDKYESLQNYLPKSLIPVDFNGELKEYDTIPWLRNALKSENLERLAH